MDGQFIRCHAIAALQTANQIESFQNLLASFRVVIFFFQQVTKLDTDFFHLVLCALQTRCQRLEAFVQITDLIHGFRCLPKLQHGALFPSSGVYLFVGSAQGAVDLFRPQIAFPFSGKLVRLPRLQLCRVQFLDPALQVLLAFVSLGVFFAQGGKTAAAFAPDLIGAGDFALLLLKGRVAEGIQKPHVIFGVQQALMLVLPVNVYQQFGKPPQKSERDDGSANAADIPVARYFPLDGNQAVVVRKLLLGQYLPGPRAV